ncbi:cytochrome C [Pedobacter changchengzhani]|uniref:Cytochrome C n=1 Tax=Pedobacter changchengzhani TaxID=2529274 RepID=A0A4R5MJV2_9SPHI|nr:cytochrome C [Pedobacter changchengzhani]TDG35900.1 cytochrome C [Pedobacter changchengzhani]
MEARSKIYIFIDEDTQPIAELVAPVNFELDTTKLIDGKHTLKIVSKDPTGKEGVRHVPFEVRNGPAISIEGIKENAVVDGIIPLMVNAYGKGDSKNFLIEGSETPQSIPFWIFILLILFVAWSAYFFFTSSAVELFTK